LEKGYAIKEEIKSHLVGLKSNKSYQALIENGLHLLHSYQQA